MAAGTATATGTTFSAPESITISGEIGLEALALLNAYAEIGADFRLDGDCDPFYVIASVVERSLMEALGRDLGRDLCAEPFWGDLQCRSAVLRHEIRSHLDGPALGAIAATKMAYDISEVKARLEYGRAR